jgi:DNA repair protein RecO (recombination protein O)
MQTRVVDQPAFVLHRRDWQNSSLILDLLTLDFGRISVLAKGAKRSRSQALFQPFYQLVISWSGRGELKTLVAIDGSATPVGEQQYLSMLYVNELIIAFLPVQESSPELFRLYSDLLDNAGQDLSEMQLRSFERSLMKMLGYLPDTGVEAESGERIQAGGYYQFIASSGFVTCNKTDKNAISGELIIAWNLGQYDSRQVLQMVKTVMRYIIDFNLHGKTLKSRDIYRQIKGRT